MRHFFLAGLTLSLALAVSGCLQEQRYMTPEGGGLWAFAIDETTPAFFESEDGNLYLVEERVPIQFREPTDEEYAAASDVGDAQIPYATLPILQRGDIEIQIDYTISNLSEDRILVGLQVNGFNEFHEFVPGVQVIERVVTPDYSEWERNVLLDPGERITGTIREEEMDEVAVDLATVVNGAPNSNQIHYFDNDSATDARSQMYIPDVVPALTGVRLGLRSSDPVPIVLEATVRVRDVRGVLVQGNDDPWVAPTPALFMAVAPMEP